MVVGLADVGGLGGGDIFAGLRGARLGTSEDVARAVFTAITDGTR